MPVSIGAKFNHVPFITHDSDALPGISNRIAARWATYQATGMPAKYYSYPKKTVKVVGVPTDSRFRKYSKSEQAILREKLGIEKDAQIILITGGSNGARRMNQSIISILPSLMNTNKNLYVLHQIGAGNEDQIKKFPDNLKKRVDFFGYSSELFHMSAVADVIITRAGASAIADFAYQEKACIVIPNPYLTGGHQLHNAKVYQDAEAALIIQESEMLKDPEVIEKAVKMLLEDGKKRKMLASNLGELSPKQNSSAAIADLLEEIAGC